MSSLFEQQIEEGTCLGLNLDYERPKYEDTVVTSPYEAASLVKRLVNYVKSTSELLTPATKKVVVDGLLNVGSILSGEAFCSDTAKKSDETSAASGIDEKTSSSDNSSEPTSHTEASKTSSVHQNDSVDDANVVIHHHNIEPSSEFDKSIERLEHHFRFRKEIYDELSNRQLDYLDKIKEYLSRFKSFGDLVQFLIRFIEQDNGFFREQDFLFLLVVYVLKHSEDYIHLLRYSPIGTKYEVEHGHDERLKAYDDLMKRIDDVTRT